MVFWAINLRFFIISKNILSYLNNKDFVKYHAQVEWKKKKMKAVVLDHKYYKIYFLKNKDK